MKLLITGVSHKTAPVEVRVLAGLVLILLVVVSHSAASSDSRIVQVLPALLSVTTE